MSSTDRSSEFLCLCQHDGWFRLQKTESGWIQVKMIIYTSDLMTAADDQENLSMCNRQQRAAGHRVTLLSCLVYILAHFVLFLMC